VLATRTFVQTKPNSALIEVPVAQIHADSSSQYCVILFPFWKEKHVEEKKHLVQDHIQAESPNIYTHVYCVLIYEYRYAETYSIWIL